MKKDSFWNQLISSIAGLGIPGLVLLVVMSSTGFAGAAALTSALAAMGGPMGMLGGIAVLGVLSMMAKGLAAYGLDAIFYAVVDELEKRGIHSEDIVEYVESLRFVPAFIKRIIIDMIRVRGLGEDEGVDRPRTLRSFVSPARDLEVGAIVELRELHSSAFQMIRILEIVSDVSWKGRVEGDDSSEIVNVLFMEDGLREFVSPTRSLTVGESYHLPEWQSGQMSLVLIEVMVDDGFWLGIVLGVGGEEEIVNVVHHYK